MIFENAFIKLSMQMCNRLWRLFYVKKINVTLPFIVWNDAVCV